MPDAIQHTVSVARSPEEVWRVLVDLSRWPAWFPQCVAARPEGSRDPFAKGGGGRVDVELAAPFIGRLVLELELVECEPGRSVRWKGRAPGVRADHRYTLAPDDKGGTTLSSTARFGGLLAALTTNLARAQLTQRAGDSLEKLRRLVEQ